MSTNSANVIRQSLPNVKSSRADNVPHLWGAVDTTGVAGVPIATLELTWHDQGLGHREGALYARKDGGAWVTISTDTAEHEPTRESFAIPAEVLGGKLELAFSVGAQGGHKLFITNAEVEITTTTVSNLVGRWCVGMLCANAGGPPGWPLGPGWSTRVFPHFEPESSGITFWVSLSL